MNNSLQSKQFSSWADLLTGSIDSHTPLAFDPVNNKFITHGHFRQDVFHLNLALSAIPQSSQVVLLCRDLYNLALALTSCWCLKLTPVLMGEKTPSQFSTQVTQDFKAYIVDHQTDQSGLFLPKDEKNESQNLSLVSSQPLSPNLQSLTKTPAGTLSLNDALSSDKASHLDDASSLGKVNSPASFAVYAISDILAGDCTDRNDLTEGNISTYGNTRTDCIACTESNELSNSNALFSLAPSDQLPIIFFTSGSQGQPKLVRKTLLMMEQESAIIAQEPAFREHFNSWELVVSTVFANHLYGLTFALFYPLLHGKVFSRTPVRFSEELFAYIPLTKRDTKYGSKLNSKLNHEQSSELGHAQNSKQGETQNFKPSEAPNTQQGKAQSSEVSNEQDAEYGYKTGKVFLVSSPTFIKNIDPKLNEQKLLPVSLTISAGGYLSQAVVQGYKLSPIIDIYGSTETNVIGLNLRCSGHDCEGYKLFNSLNMLFDFNAEGELSFALASPLFSSTHANQQDELKSPKAIETHKIDPLEKDPLKREPHKIAPLNMEPLKIESHKIEPLKVETLKIEDNIAFGISAHDVLFAPSPCLPLQKVGLYELMDNTVCCENGSYTGKVASNLRFVVLGRSDDIVKIGEQRISLKAVSQSFCSLEQVSECIVLDYNLPLQERKFLGAIIVLKDQYKHLADSRIERLQLRKEWQQMLKGKISSNAFPRYMLFVENIPTNALGKISFPELRKILLNSMEQKHSLQHNQRLQANTAKKEKANLELQANLELDGSKTECLVQNGTVPEDTKSEQASLVPNDSGANDLIPDETAANDSVTNGSLPNASAANNSEANSLVPDVSMAQTSIPNSLNQESLFAQESLEDVKKRLLQSDISRFVARHQTQLSDAQASTPIQLKQANGVSLPFAAQQAHNLNFHPELTDLRKELDEHGLLLSGSCSIKLNPDLLWFTGHFIDFPILPGVAQIDMINTLVEHLTEHAYQVGNINQVKFTRPLNAGEIMVLELKCRQKRGADNKIQASANLTERVNLKESMNAKEKVSCQEVIKSKEGVASACQTLEQKSTKDLSYTANTLANAALGALTALNIPLSCDFEIKCQCADQLMLCAKGNCQLIPHVS